jgi:Fe-S cluster biogenesis protein NfuA
MLARCSRTSGSHFLARFFAEVAAKSIDDRCTDVFNKVIRPALMKEGADVTFHGVKDDCAVITLEGTAETTNPFEHNGLVNEILQVLQIEVPEVKYCRQRFVLQDGF